MDNAFIAVMHVSLFNKMYNLKHLNNQEGFSLDCNESILHSIAGKYVIGYLSKLNTIEINSQTMLLKNREFA